MLKVRILKNEAVVSAAAAEAVVLKTLGKVGMCDAAVAKAEEPSRAQKHIRRNIYDGVYNMAIHHQ